MQDTSPAKDQDPQEDPVERILQKVELAVSNATRDNENMTNVEVLLVESNDVVDEVIQEIQETWGALVHEMTGEDYVRGKYRYLQINLNHKERFKPDFSKVKGAADMLKMMKAETPNVRNEMLERMGNE